jgi:stress response protein YsnF
MPTLDEVRSWRGSKVTDRDGQKVGTIEDVYLDRQSGEPQWAAIKTGLLGSKVSFAPLEGVVRDGNELVVPYAKDTIKDAPSVEDDGELTPGEERRLFEYYGRPDYDAWDGRVDATEATLGRDERSWDDQAVEPVSGDGEMIRSEEELQVDVRRREPTRARLRKYIVSEPVEETVTIHREQAHLEREPVTGRTVTAAGAAPELAEEEREVVLGDEEAVVEKRVVPKERVRLGKEVVEEQETVRGELRKEVVEPDVPADLEQRRGA